MPITIDDVKRHMGPVPIIDPGIVFSEVQRRMPMGGIELEGMRKDMMITRVVNDILEQPQISGQSKWEDRYLYAKGDGVSKLEMKSWMAKSQRPLSIQPKEYGQFFSWLKSYDGSPWQIEDINTTMRTIKVMHKDRGVMTDLTYDGAMNILRKSLGWSDADVFEYWDFKKSMLQGSLRNLSKEMQIPGGVRLSYGGDAGGYVDVTRVKLANKSFIAPDLRGRDVVIAMHKNMRGAEIELGTFVGVDDMDQAYKYAKSFTEKMAKMCGDLPGEKKKSKGKGKGLAKGKGKGPKGNPFDDKEDKKELLGKGQGIDNSRMLVGNGGNMLGMSVQDLYDAADGKR
jgi:hypothetical protein